MPHHEAQDEGDLVNLDSFSDIMTNVVAMLIIVIMVGIVGGGAMIAQFYFKNRIVRDTAIDDQHRAVYIDVSHGRVTVIPTREVAQVLAPSADGRVAVTTVATRFYDVMVDDLEGVMFVRKSTDNHGETVAMLENKTSEFQRTLDGLDKTKDFLFFLVAADSVEEFRVARKAAEDRGFFVGWKPMSKSDAQGAIVFSPAGMTPKIQQ